MHEWPSDAEALRQSLNDPERFEDVFDRHYAAVRRYLQRRCGLDAGEELAAQTFLVAFGRRATFDARYPSARPWLLGIATNLLRHHRREERTRLHAYARLPVESAGPDVDDDAVAASLAFPLVARALAAVEARDRDALLLLVFGDLSYNEIAEALGVPAGTVRSRIHRARRQLRERLPTLEAIRGVNDAEPVNG